MSYQQFDFSGGDQVVDRVYRFTTGLQWEDAPREVRERVKLLLLDLCGVLACGSGTPLSGIIRDFAAAQFGAGSARAWLPFDGREVSPAGAALATGMSIDSIDAHDGHLLVKGHIGCAALAALLAYSDDLWADDLWADDLWADDLDSDGGRELLAALLVGYELGARCGRALHESPDTAAQYHASGSWVALACAAMGARLMGFDRETFRHALGIAEYHGPRGLMLKVTWHPSMLKDSSGWGAMAGVSAAYLARAGFTGAPVILLENRHLQHYWDDLGDNWETLGQYVKPQPVCRWAQPPVEAVAALMQRHAIDHREIEAIEVETFEEACRLSVAPPRDTEQAQYNIAYPIAAQLLRGRVGVAEVSDAALFTDADILRLMACLRMRRGAEYDALFPAVRKARVRIRLRGGEQLDSGATAARGDPDSMLDADEFRAKFDALAEQRLDAPARDALAAAITELDQSADAWRRLRQLLGGTDSRPRRLSPAGPRPGAAPG